MKQVTKPLPAIPSTRDCQGHTLRRDEDGPRVSWVVIFDYPDCTREFDGHGWKVTAKPGSKVAA